MADWACPHCGMAIYDDEALSCHQCGQLLSRPGSGALSRIRYEYKILWIFVALLVLSALVLVIVF